MKHTYFNGPALTLAPRPEAQHLTLTLHNPTQR